MYKNFIITESEKKDILKMHRNYGKQINENDDDKSDIFGKEVIISYSDIIKLKEWEDELDMSYEFDTSEPLSFCLPHDKLKNFTNKILRPYRNTYVHGFKLLDHVIKQTEDLEKKQFLMRLRKLFYACKFEDGIKKRWGN